MDLVTPSLSKAAAREEAKNNLTDVQQTEMVETWAY
jgi:hypothetical protein